MMPISKICISKLFKPIHLNVFDLECRLISYIPNLDLFEKELRNNLLNIDLCKQLSDGNYAFETFLYCIRLNLFENIKIIIKYIDLTRFFAYYSTQTGQDALSTVIITRNEFLLHFLLNYETFININQRDLLGRTAFFKAVLWGNISAARILIKRGCDIYVCNNDNNNIFDYISDIRNDKKLLAILKSNNSHQHGNETFDFDMICKFIDSIS